MKKCDLYLNFIDSEVQLDSSHQGLKDVLAHAEHCVDCSYDKKVRDNLLKSLENMPEPEYPENLHEMVVSSALEIKEPLVEENPWFDKLFFGLLRPLEFLVPAVCVVMLFFMVQLNSGYSYEGDNSVKRLSESPLRKTRVAEAGVNVNEVGLPKVSSEEVKEFLAKLDEFQRLHPESKTIEYINRPEVRLVTDR